MMRTPPKESPPASPTPSPTPSPPQRVASVLRRRYFAFLAGFVTVLLLMIIGVLLILEQKYSQYIDLAFFDTLRARLERLEGR